MCFFLFAWMGGGGGVSEAGDSHPNTSIWCWGVCGGCMWGVCCWMAGLQPGPERLSQTEVRKLCEPGYEVSARNYL